jgi:hypothetical protein
METRRRYVVFAVNGMPGLHYSMSMPRASDQYTIRIGRTKRTMTEEIPGGVQTKFRAGQRAFML